MKISIPTSEIQVTYVDGANNITPEPRVTLDNWQISGRIQPQTPSVDNGNALFEDGNTIYEVTRESLLDIFPGGDGIVFDNPMVWVADVEIFDLPMPTSIVAPRIPTGGVDEFENIYKYTSSGTSVKTVGEWMDSLCEIWKNDVTGKVQIYTSPINARFIEFHLARAFALEFTVANHGTLTENTDYIVVSQAETARAADPTNWIKQQPL